MKGEVSKSDSGHESLCMIDALIDALGIHAFSVTGHSNLKFCKVTRSMSVLKWFRRFSRKKNLFRVPRNFQRRAYIPRQCLHGGLLEQRRRLPRFQKSLHSKVFPGNGERHRVAAIPCEHVTLPHAAADFSSIRFHLQSFPCIIRCIIFELLKLPRF